MTWAEPLRQQKTSKTNVFGLWAHYSIRFYWACYYCRQQHTQSSLSNNFIHCSLSSHQNTNIHIFTTQQCRDSLCVWSLSHTCTEINECVLDQERITTDSNWAQSWIITSYGLSSLWGVRLWSSLESCRFIINNAHSLKRHRIHTTTINAINHR